MAFTPKFSNNKAGRDLKSTYDAVKKLKGPGAAKILLWNGRPGYEGAKAPAKKKKKTA